MLQGIVPRLAPGYRVNCFPRMRVYTQHRREVATAPVASGKQKKQFHSSSLKIPLKSHALVVIAIHVILSHILIVSDGSQSRCFDATDSNF